MTIQEIITMFVDNGVTIGVIIGLMWMCKFLFEYSFKTQESKIDKLAEKIDNLVDVVYKLINKSDDK